MSETSLIHWKDDFNTGIEEVDLQHRYFAKLINRLGKELSSADDKIYQSMLLKELTCYAVFHFTSEENLMFSLNYPDLLRHKEAHNALVEELNQKNNYFKLSKVTSKSLIDFLIEWFVQHTTKVDKEFGEYAVTEGQK